MNKTAPLMVVVLALAFLAGALAATIIKSNLVDVTVEDYTITLAANATTVTLGETINFTGTLSTPSYTIEDQLITLHYSNDTATGQSDLTDADGFYTILWTATEAGSFTFYTKAEIV